jgi:hypothetical protein
MITFLAACGHEYTTAKVRKLREGPPTTVLSYDALFRRKTLPPATYVFTDFDRLNFWELHLAALVYNRIEAAGWQPLNNPARARQRHGLLRRLYDAGINQFQVYRVETGEKPQRYPVFVRGESAHQGPLTGLIADRKELESAIETLIAAGNPERHLIITEYAAEPIRPDLYRKYQMFRIGERIFPSFCFHNDTWIMKAGKTGIAGQELYEEENLILRQNPYEELVRPAFEIAQINYGRADFGIVNGKVQIYEINTNPDIGHGGSHPFPIREDTHRLAWNYYIEALAAIDRKPGVNGGSSCARVVLSDPALQQRRRWWISPESRRATA